MKETKHLIKRGTYWHFSAMMNGVSYRHSTKCTELAEARKYRDAVMEQHKKVAVIHWWREAVMKWDMSATGWIARTYGSMQRRTTKKGWSTIMSKDELVELVCRSNGECSITKIPFSFLTPVQNRNPFNISPDRIDCSKGYEFTNVRMVCHVVNLAMSHWGAEVVRQMSRALVAAELCENSSHQISRYNQKEAKSLI